MQTLAQYLPPLIDSDGVFELPAADASTGRIDACDIAACAAAVLTDAAPVTVRTRTLTGPASPSMHDIAAELSAVTGRAIRYESVGSGAAGEVLRRHGLPAEMTGFLPATTTQFVAVTSTSSLTTWPSTGAAPLAHSDSSSKTTRTSSDNWRIPVTLFTDDTTETLNLGHALQPGRSDVTAEGHQIKLTNIVDGFTREALAMRVGRTCDADQLVNLLDAIASERGAPASYLAATDQN